MNNYKYVTDEVAYNLDVVNSIINSAPTSVAMLNQKNKWLEFESTPHKGVTLEDEGYKTVVVLDGVTHFVGVFDNQRIALAEQRCYLDQLANKLKH